MTPSDRQSKNNESLPTYEEEQELKEVMMRRHHAPLDIDAEWAKIAKRVEGEHAATTPKHLYRQSGVVWTSVAAAIIAVVLLMRHAMTSDSVIVVERIEQPIAVTLTSANGQVITFDQCHINLTTIATDTLAKLASAESAEVMTIHTSRSKTCDIILSDNTHVWLNADSEMEFPSQFVGDTRTVSIKGEAYFDVAKDATHPFVVVTEGFSTTVLGTEFCIRSRGAKDASVTLVEGSLRVDGEEKSVVITPDHQATVNATSIDVHEVDTYPLIQWKEGYFYFNNTPLSQILCELGRWYNINIIVEDADLLDLRLHLVSEHSHSIAELIDIFNAIGTVHARLEDENLVVSR